MIKVNRSTSQTIDIKEAVAYKKITNCTKTRKKYKISNKILCDKAKRK